MTTLTFQPGRNTSFSSAAAQQKSDALKQNIATAHAECGCTDTAQSYVARGVFYGMLISAPLWVIIGGSVFLVCRLMG